VPRQGRASKRPIPEDHAECTGVSVAVKAR